MMSKKKENVIYSSSSEADEDEDAYASPAAAVVAEKAVLETRSSERIRCKQSRQFSMPSRQKIFNEIPSVKSPDKIIQSLQPRKLINNYTKENNRYNFDPAYTSGEESIEENFIDDVEEETDSSAQSEEKNVFDKKATPQRRRILKLEESSDSEDDDVNSCAKKKRKFCVLDSSDESTASDSENRQGQSSQSSDIPTNDQWKKTKKHLNCDENVTHECDEAKNKDLKLGHEVNVNDMSSAESEDSDVAVCVSSSRYNVIDSDEEEAEGAHGERLKSPRAEAMAGRKQTWRTDILGAYVAKRKERHISQ